MEKKLGVMNQEARTLWFHPELQHFENFAANNQLESKKMEMEWNFICQKNYFL